MKGRVLEVLTDSIVGHKIVTVSAKQEQEDLISCRTSGNSGLGSKQKSTFCKMVSQIHSVESRIKTSLAERYQLILLHLKTWFYDLTVRFPYLGYFLFLAQ